MNEFWIGLDGTDSPFGGCTTWTMSNIIDILTQKDPEIEFIGYPRLIRLNPNIPDKTRGNGALSLHIKTRLMLDKLSHILIEQIKTDRQKYRLNPDKLPGLVIFDHNPESTEPKHALVTYLDFNDFLTDFDPVFSWPEKNQSHIGAIAAVSLPLEADATFELLAYRSLENCGTPRKINEPEVKAIDTDFPTIFSSFDRDQSRELIAPSGPDPVFLGIRGSNPQHLQEAFYTLNIPEALESYTIFLTNQGTDDHFREVSQAFDDYGVFTGIVTIIAEPEEIRGGHVFVQAHTRDRVVQLNFFEPTKNLRDAARDLYPSDKVFIAAAVNSNSDGISLNVEYLQIIDAVPRVNLSPPKCSNCQETMTSAGRFAGYKCKSCGSRSHVPERSVEPVPFYPGESIYATKSAQRHLTRPLERQLDRFNPDEYQRKSVDYHQFRSML